MIALLLGVLLRHGAQGKASWPSLCGWDGPTSASSFHCSLLRCCLWKDGMVAAACLHLSEVVNIVTHDLIL